MVRRVMAVISVGVVCAALLGCDQVGSFSLEVRVGLSVTQGGDVSGGAIITFSFSNTGEAVVEPDGGRFTFIVLNGAGQEIRRVDSVQDAAMLETGDTLDGKWDRRDASGVLAGPGAYAVVMPYRSDGQRRSMQQSFIIQ